MPWLTDPSITSQMSQPPNPLEAYMRFAQLKQMGQEQQYNQARLAHLTQEDERSKAMLPTDVASAQTAIKERLSKLDTDQLTQLKTKNELLAQYLGVVDSAPPEAKPQAYQFSVAAAERDKLIPPGVAPPWGPQAEMLVKQQLGQASTVQQHIDNEFKNRQQTDVETQNAAVRTNMVGQRDLQKRGQDMTALTAKMGQGVTMRGQNMTDARAASKKDLDEQGIEAAAQSLAGGELSSLKDIASMRGGQRLLIFKRAKELNPNFNTSEIDRKIKMEADLDNGKLGQTNASFGTFLEHAGAASEVVNKYRASNVRILNTPLNKLRNAFGDTAYTEYVTALEPVKKEAENFLLNGHAQTETDKKAANDILSTDATMAQQQAALKQLGHTVKARFNENNFRYRRVSGHDMRDVFTPEALAGAKQIGVDMGGGSASAGPKAGAIEGGYRFKGGDPADQKNWEKQ